MLDKHPCYEGMSWNDASGPNNVMPFHLAGLCSVLKLPQITEADCIVCAALEVPCPRHRATYFELRLNVTNLFPIPATVIGGLIIPPIVLLYISAVHPSYPQDVFLVEIAQTNLTIFALF